MFSRHLGGFVVTFRSKFELISPLIKITLSLSETGMWHCLKQRFNILRETRTENWNRHLSFSFTFPLSYFRERYEYLEDELTGQTETRISFFKISNFGWSILSWDVPLSTNFLKMSRKFKDKSKKCIWQNFSVLELRRFGQLEWRVYFLLSD